MFVAVNANFVFRELRKSRYPLLVSFGMKFYPGFKGIKPRSLEINVGANIPYTSSYWMFHFGAVSAQVSYYL